MGHIVRIVRWWLVVITISSLRNLVLIAMGMIHPGTLLRCTRACSHNYCLHRRAKRSCPSKLSKRFRKRLNNGLESHSALLKCRAQRRALNESGGKGLGTLATHLQRDGLNLDITKVMRS